MQIDGNEFAHDVMLKERSDVDVNKAVYQSGYCGMLTPIEVIECVPGDKININFNVETELARCSGVVRSAMSSEFYAVFVPNDQVFTDYNSYLFTSTGAGANHPYRSYDLNTNTNDLLIPYYLLPYASGAHTLDINMIPFRQYQKIYYDLFSEPAFRHDSSTSPDLYYRTTGGNDTLTTMYLRGIPTNNKYLNKLLTNLSTSGSVSAPFTIRDLQSAIVNERIYILKKKYGNKILDLISKIFNVKNLPSNSVIPVSVVKSSLGNFTVLQTDNTAPSKPTTRFIGYTNQANINYTANWYGNLFILGTVKPDDFAIQRGLNPLFDNDYKKDGYGYYRPEAQGLAYKSLLRRNLDVDGASPTSTLASECLYDHLRGFYNESKGAFSRSSGLANQVVNLTGVGIANYLYYTETSFSNLFAENPQVRYKLNLSGKINRQIKKYVEFSNL